MDHIYCYFLGAGASCNALPLVKDIPARLQVFIERLREWSIKTGANAESLASVAEWLLDNTKRHTTIDTFAKKLYIRGSFEELKKLKAVTSCFFVYEQSQSHADSRYDTFFASVLQRRSDLSVQIPDNLRFITWNYDTQLERAFYEFCEDYDAVMTQLTFSDSVEHLNGYCGTHPPGHLGPAYNASVGGSKYDGLNAAIGLFDEYFKTPNAVPPDINFAWETDPPIFRRNIQSMLNQVTVLVIIGYSFPFFNREIDRIVFEELTSLREIYIQVPERDHAAVDERMHALKAELPQTRYLRDTSSFYIPLDYS